MVFGNQYKSKLTDSHTAVEQIGSNSLVAIGQAVCQPPALMEALASRAEAGKVDNVKLYYMHAEQDMKRSLLRYELMGRIKPYCMFMQEAERDLNKKGQEDGDRKVVYYVPNSFSQSIRFFTEHIHVDTFLVTVSPMDRNGYFTFGTNNDYTSTAARQAKRLIVEVNRHMPRVTFAMGDEAFYDFLHDNVALESHPVDYVNDPVVIAQNDNVVSINSTIEMDLTGACNSEYVKGHQFTSTGGQLDFVRGAYASKGGMSFIAFQSSIKGGKISKIVPRLSGPVTTPRTDVHYVVTENGVANLKGLSSTERAHALIGLADPAFQDELTAAAKSMHLI
jgi:acyl-CoA hydrolase